MDGCITDWLTTSSEQCLCEWLGYCGIPPAKLTSSQGGEDLRASIHFQLHFAANQVTSNLFWFSLSICDCSHMIGSPIVLGVPCLSHKVIQPTSGLFTGHNWIFTMWWVLKQIKVHERGTQLFQHQLVRPKHYPKANMSASIDCMFAGRVSKRWHNEALQQHPFQL